VIYEETFKWAHLRQVYGKRLIDQPVVRQKIAHMLAKVEQGQTWLEHITYQMTLLPYAEQSRLLAGPMALLKAFLSKSQGEIVSEGRDQIRLGAQR
jgi:alkylation response protein AidB-like acyl-CoA dehydrogenase